MVRGKGKGKEILSYSERQNLADQKKEAEAVLKETQDPGIARGVDQGSIKKEIAHLDKVIHDGTAPRTSGVAKDRMAARATELKDQISQGMPTRHEMDHPAKCPGAVQKHMSWDKRTQAAKEEYKQIQRRINPDAPVNVESFRKDK